MSVIITPAEQLEFHRPFTRISKESLIVKNPGEQPIAFKVKTTAPKQYCVRPNAGRIEANSEIEVQIILQPFKEELPEDFKCKDKFLVQTAPIQEAFEQLDISTMWSQIETTEKGSMHQHKIKCVFLPPVEDSASSVTTTTTTTATATATAVATAVEDDTVTLIPDAAITAEPVVASIQQQEEEKEKDVPPPVNHIIEPTVIEEKPAPPVTKTTPPPPPPPPSNKEEELKAALEKIALLEKKLTEEEGLRARTGRKLAPTVQPLDAVHQHLAALEKPRPTEGYPPQVVFGVAFLVFIITYLFF